MNKRNVRDLKRVIEELQNIHNKRIVEIGLSVTLEAYWPFKDKIKLLDISTLFEVLAYDGKISSIEEKVETMKEKISVDCKESGFLRKEVSKFDELDNLFLIYRTQIKSVKAVGETLNYAMNYFEFESEILTLSDFDIELENGKVVKKVKSKGVREVKR